MYQLGVDIGTSANAMYALALDPNGVPSKHLWHELMVFGEPIIPKTGALKNSKRRAARVARRRLDRKVSRVKKIWHIANGCGVDSKQADQFAIEVIAAKDGYQTKGTERIWELRARAARTKVPFEALFYIATTMAKHRGYNAIAPQKAVSIKKAMDSGKPVSKDDLLSTSYGLCVADRWKAEHPGQTPAEILLGKKLNGEIRSFLNKEQKTTEEKTKTFKNGDLYAFHRDDYLREFTLILDEQRKHYPILDEPVDALYKKDIPHDVRSRYFWDKNPKTIAEALLLSVFHQNTPKSFEGLIGPCSLDPGTPENKNKRIVMSHPAAEKFRAAKVASDLRWKGRSGTEALTAEQRELLIRIILAPWEFGLKVSETSKIEMDEVYSLLQEHGMARPADKALSLDTVRQRKLSVCNHKPVLSSLGVWDEYCALSDQARNRFFEAWSDVISKTDSWGFDGRRENLLSDPYYGQEVISLFDKIASLQHEIPSLRSVKLRDGRMSYCEKTSLALFEFMIKNDCDEHAAKSALYPLSTKKTLVQSLKTKSDFNRAIPKIVSPEDKVNPGEYAIEVINPVVRRSLRELRQAMIRKFTKFGPPTSVTIEMTREAKSSQKEKDLIATAQRNQDDIKEAAAVLLRSLNLKVSKENILRVQLLWEQGGICPYTGEAITTAEAVNGLNVHKDHIAPRASVHNANARRFLVLTKSSFNLKKSNSATLYDYYKASGNLQGYKDLEARLKHLEKNFPQTYAGKSMPFLKKAFQAKKALLLRATPYGAEDSDESFAERQLVETAYIAKVAQELFDSVCPNNVFGSRGKYTALIRGEQMLRAENIIPDDLISKRVIPPLEGAVSSTLENKSIEAIRRRAAAIRKEHSALEARNTSANKGETLRTLGELEKGSDGGISLAEALEHKASVLEAEPCGLFYERKGSKRVFNKRVDHRQHLVDACAIALSTRKLVNALLEQEAKASARETDPDFNYVKAKFIPEGIRDELSRIVSGFVVMQKPDRLSGGALLEETTISPRLATGPAYHLKGIKSDRNGTQYRYFKKYDGTDYAIASPEKGKSRVLKFDSSDREPIEGEAKIHSGDILRNKKTGEMWRVGFISSSGDICCVYPSLTLDFNTLAKEIPFADLRKRKISLSTVAKNWCVIKNRFRAKDGS